ncbi:MAG: hypothetical protein H6Q84_716 [Deltaproteobacteria bacterium]|nr:hypothetical protein [Deltaproteobacteria bacterium]MBP2678304.1 hypothetical protein [Deltaproteobacteria bacterium]
MDLKAALPWIVAFFVVLGIYLFVRSRRIGKK